MRYKLRLSESSWTPTHQDVYDLNKIRQQNGLPPISRDQMRTIGDWQRACDENDKAAEESEAETNNG